MLNSIFCFLYVYSVLLVVANGFCLSSCDLQYYGQICSEKNDNARIQTDTCSRSSRLFHSSVFASADGSIVSSKEEENEEGSVVVIEYNDDDFDGDDVDTEYSSYEIEQQNILDETYEWNLQIAKLARASSVRNKTAAWMAHDILRNKQKYSDTVAYNSVLKAFAKSSSFHNKQAANVAQELLEEMRQLNEIQLAQNQEWYDRLDCGDGAGVDDEGTASTTCIVDQEQQQNENENNENAENEAPKLSPLTEEELSMGPPLIRVKPNVRSFSTVMDAWGKQGNPTAAKKAESLLYELVDVYDQTGDVALQPNSISYNTVITAWSKAGAGREGAERAQNLLDVMIRYSFADVISYNAVLHAWARSGLPDAGEYAEKILRSMDDGDVLPNARTYTTTMDAWSRSFGCAESTRRAMALLSELEDRRHERPTDDTLKPNCVTYSTVINALAVSKTEPLKAHKAFGLLQRMNRLGKEDPDVRPNRVTYNSVLNACATSCPTSVKTCLEEQGMSSNLPTLPAMVRTIYEQLLTIDTRQQPDHFTFGTVLKAVANLFWGEPDQVEFGKQVFLEACNRGQVSFGVLSQLRQALPTELYRELLPPDAISPGRSDPLMNHIPKEWTRNVKENKRRRRP